MRIHKIFYWLLSFAAATLFLQDILPIDQAILPAHLNPYYFSCFSAASLVYLPKPNRPLFIMAGVFLLLQFIRLQWL